MLYVPAYTHERRPFPGPQDLRPAQDLWSVFHPGPYGLWGIFRVTVCFGTIGKEGLLGNRWAHRWIQQTFEQY